MTIELLHLSDAWDLLEHLAVEWLREYPGLGLTWVKDAYGRSWFGIESALDPSELDPLNRGRNGLHERLQIHPQLTPFLAAEPVVCWMDLVEGLQLLLKRGRKPIAERFFLLDNPLTGKSWLAPRLPASDMPALAPVVAFYSYKGGVGRSALLAMTALHLAREGHRVLVVDLDLEAPGIEGAFFASDNEDGRVQYGLIDWLLERSLHGTSFAPDLDDYLLYVTDSELAARGGRLAILPAGKTGPTYISRLGRLNPPLLADADPRHSLLRGLLASASQHCGAGLILIDCRTGMTDLGGLALNGLSDVDVLVFRGGMRDRTYLNTVLAQLKLQEPSVSLTRDDQIAALAKRLLIVYNMVELPPEAEERERFMQTLLEFTSGACYRHIFRTLCEKLNYSYPALNSRDTSLEPVPHDAVYVPYLRDYARVSLAGEMYKVQREQADHPIAALADRLIQVKLEDRFPREVPHAAATTPTSSGILPMEMQVREVIAKLGSNPDAAQDLDTDEHMRERFLPLDTYSQMLEDRTFIVLGRKGSGKSALFRVLNQPSYARHLLAHFGRSPQGQPRTLEDSAWIVGFESNHALHPYVPALLTLAKESGNGVPSLDLLQGFWRAVLAWRLYAAEGRLEELPTALKPLSYRSIIEALKSPFVHAEIQECLNALDTHLSSLRRRIVVSFDELDVGLGQDESARGPLVSALVALWLSLRGTLRAIRTKIFLREDLWEREVRLDDKAKVRNSMDRVSLEWNPEALYRLVLKRLGAFECVRQFWRDFGLWNSSFERQLSEPLGWIPPLDPGWIRSAVESLAGAHMGSNVRKGQVYTWIPNHAADANQNARPRIFLLLFAEAAKLSQPSRSATPLLRPEAFREALRKDVSEAAVDELRNEYRIEWSISPSSSSVWVPDTFKEYQELWPVEESALHDFYRQPRFQPFTERILDILKQMRDAGLLKGRGGQGQLQIPDIYLYGLGLRRKGG